MRVAIGSDHAGFELKEAIKAFLTSENREVLDVGTYSKDPVDYPDFTEAVGSAVRDARAERGIILCGSGVGASMTANRIPGIRAGLCHDTYSAHQGVEHDDMNVLVIGGRVVGVELARELVSAFLNATFTGNGRHVQRLAKMVALENPVRALQLFGQSVWLDYIRSSLITERRTAAPDRRRRREGRHLESVGLRKGHCRQLRLHRAAAGTGRPRAGCQRDVRAHRDPGRPRRRRRAARRLRSRPGSATATSASRCRRSSPTTPPPR